MYNTGTMSKILFIEDDQLIVKIYTTRLQADGHTVFSSYNGADGIAIAQKEIPDLIVCDVMMPQMDGFEVLKRLKADEKTRHIIVLMYSNLAQEEEMKKAKELGAAEFIVKANISPVELVEKIKGYLTPAQ